MNIIVFDVPAEHGGALSILNDFYNEVREHDDKTINWIFVISKPELEETENIKILRFPWIKKSWGHRIYFDQVIAPRIVKKYKSDKIFSLQNVIIPCSKVNQTVYIHQPLPFVDYKFSFKENKLFWLYQNIISEIIMKSIRKADKVIVQTNWLKKACIEKSYVYEDKISVVPPQIEINVTNFFRIHKKNLSTFFYPASAYTYKNHRVIVDACKILKLQNINNYKVLFTLNGDESTHIAEIYDEVKKQQLPIEFIGSISRKQVYNYYSKSVLIFPSYIETFGLPMLEAKLHGGVILASDCPFSHEILDGYDNAVFFNCFNNNMLAELMLNTMKQKIRYKDMDNLMVLNNYQKNSLINHII